MGDELPLSPKSAQGGDTKSKQPESDEEVYELVRAVPRNGTDVEMAENDDRSDETAPRECKVLGDTNRISHRDAPIFSSLLKQPQAQPEMGPRQSPHQSAMQRPPGHDRQRRDEDTGMSRKGQMGAIWPYISRIGNRDNEIGSCLEHEFPGWGKLESNGHRYTGPGNKGLANDGRIRSHHFYGGKQESSI